MSRFIDKTIWSVFRGLPIQEQTDWVEGSATLFIVHTQMHIYTDTKKLNNKVSSFNFISFTGAFYTRGVLCIMLLPSKNKCLLTLRVLDGQLCDDALHFIIVLQCILRVLPSLT